MFLDGFKMESPPSLSARILRDIVPLHLDEYEERAEQFAMALRVEKAFASGRHLLSEAGTGTGKSLAYIVPAALMRPADSPAAVGDGDALAPKRRVVISTFTKVLQNQLIEKDIPMVSRILETDGRSLDFAVLFGSDNYLCLRRLDRFSPDVFSSEGLRERVLSWAAETKTGILSEFDFIEDYSAREDISREADVCMGSSCGRAADCFYRKAQARAASSDILVVNHHLFFTNIASGGRVLPPFDFAVIDEAHNAEEVALDLLGDSANNYQARKLCLDVFNPRRRRGLLFRLGRISPESKDAAAAAVSEVLAASERFFGAVSVAAGASRDTVRFLEPPAVSVDGAALSASLKNLSATLKDLIPSASGREEALDIQSKALRAQGFAAVVEEWLAHKNPDRVYWFERERRRRGERISICSTPTDISGILAEKLFGATYSVVLTSATLSVGGSFEYVKETLGVPSENCDEIILSSGFNYRDRVALYIPENMPDPRSGDAAYEDAVKKEVGEIVHLAGGRSFVLFTSYKLLNSVYAELEQSGGHTLFKQGARSHWRIIEEFKAAGNAVLCGTDSFWQGVDVPGDSLVCVILTKLPFDVPDHPVVEAKLEELRKAGKDPFSHYTLPRAVLKFRQGFGRLMRTGTDWGVVASLDPRIRTKYYGKYFLSALPEVNIISDKKILEDFFASHV
ncbi:MAG: helicase c2 [Elusimicrobia bacterium HGW-Elusimicrobia-1]|jgi:ATP-dependent DNA helicase DinG|nr:MAG: helicase c2 [Elusimicrobia bacterium HGW-Elusimicrobia-1]